MFGLKLQKVGHRTVTLSRLFAKQSYLGRPKVGVRDVMSQGRVSLSQGRHAILTEKEYINIYIYIYIFIYTYNTYTILFIAMQTLT